MIRDYIIKKGENKYTAYAGTFPIARMVQELNLDKKIDSILRSPGSNRGYNPSTYIKSIILGLLTGADCIMDIDKLREDEPLKKIWNIKDIPHSSRIGSFLNNASQKDIDHTHKITMDLAVKGIEKQCLKKVTFDADATFVETDKYGLSEYCYKEYKALGMLFGFIAETGSAIYSEFRNGSVSPAKGLYEQLVYVNEYLSNNNIKMENYRSDAAGYQSNIINYCLNNNIAFYIRANNHHIDFSRLKDFKPLYNRHNIRIYDMEITETVHAMNNTQSFRLIVIRKPKKDKQKSLYEYLDYDYYAIATNSTLTPQEVFNFYNERGKCEYYIKSVKWDLSLRKLPSGSFNGNALWVNIALMAYNFIKLFSTLTGLNRSLKTIRFLVFNVVGRVVNHSGKEYLKLYLKDKRFEFQMLIKDMCLNL